MISFELENLNGDITFGELCQENGMEWAFTNGRQPVVKGVDELLKSLDAGYKRLTVELEDVILVFPPDAGELYRTVVGFDKLSGTQRRALWTHEQISAILTLAFLGDDADPKLYKIAEPAIQGWPSEVRPIP